MTGQYSRMGTLLDPLVDRLLVISGVIVCWHFDLLPRWALALLVAREVFMMCFVRWGMKRHGSNVKVNWLGRAGRVARHVARCSSRWRASNGSRRPASTSAWRSCSGPPRCTCARRSG